MTQRMVEAKAGRLSNTRVVALLLTNLGLTVLTAGIVGPSTGKLENLFGLVGWAGRLPFYLLPLYLTPLVLWMRPGTPRATLLGLAVASPLALWAVATECAPPVPATYLASGALQGALLGWMARQPAE